LVMLMTPAGLALFYSGITGSKSILETEVVGLDESVHGERGFEI